MTTTTVDLDELLAMNGGYVSPVIDATALGSTVIWTMKNQRFIVTKITVMAMSVSLPVTPAIISVGSNNPTNNDIVAARSLLLLSAAENYITFLADANATSVDPNGTIYVKVTSAAVAGAWTFKIAIQGHYDN